MASAEWDIINSYPKEMLEIPSCFLTHNMPDPYWAALKSRFVSDAVLKDSYFASDISQSRIVWYYANYCTLRSHELTEIITDTPNFVANNYNFEYWPNTHAFSRSVFTEENLHNLLHRMYDDSPVVITLADKILEQEDITAQTLLLNYSITNQEWQDATIEELTQIMAVLQKHSSSFPAGVVIHTRSRNDTYIDEYINTTAEAIKMDISHRALTCLIPDMYEHFYTLKLAQPKVRQFNPNRTLLRRELVIDGGLFAPQE